MDLGVSRLLKLLELLVDSHVDRIELQVDLTDSTWLARAVLTASVVVRWACFSMVSNARLNVERTLNPSSGR